MTRTRKATATSETDVGNKLSLIAKAVGKHVGRHLGSEAFLTQLTPGTRTAATLAGGTNPTKGTPAACKGIIVKNITKYVLETQVQTGDQVILLLGDTIAGKLIPQMNDEILIQGVNYKIVRMVGVDPAKATYACHSRPL